MKTKVNRLLNSNKDVVISERAVALARNYTKEHLKNKLDDELLPKIKELYI